MENQILDTENAEAIRAWQYKIYSAPFSVMLWEFAKDLIQLWIAFKVSRKHVKVTKAGKVPVIFVKQPAMICETSVFVKLENLDIVE